MEVCFDICTTERCKVYVKDTTVSDTSKGYIPESSESVAKGRFKYSDTALVSIIFLERYNKTDQKVVNTVYNAHDVETKNVGSPIPITFDGVFTIYNFVIPTEDWFARMLIEHPDLLLVYDVVYTVDAENKHIYKYVKHEDVQSEGLTIDDFDKEAVDSEEIIERNTEGTTLSVACDTLVSICYLLHCYLSLCQQIFENQGFSQCFSRNNVDYQLIYKRDMVWMALNVIRYLAEFNRLQEAQRIIENIGGCNGLCNGWYEHEGLKPDCGCGRPRTPGCNCN